jgi:hypothetical protein
VIFAGSRVLARRNSMSRSSTGRVRRILPTTRGTGVICPSASALRRDARDRALQRRRKAVRVALAPHLAVGDDVDPGLLQVADREQRRVVLRLLEEFLGMRQISRMRVRGTTLDSIWRFTSQSGCG